MDFQVADQNYVQIIRFFYEHVRSPALITAQVSLDSFASKIIPINSLSTVKQMFSILRTFEYHTRSTKGLVMECHTVLKSGLQMAINCMISKYKTLYPCAFTGVGGSRQHDLICHLPAKIQLLRIITMT